MSYGEAGSYPCTTLTTVSVTNCLYTGYKSNYSIISILPVEIEMRFFPGEITIAICAGRILDHASTDGNFDFYLEKFQLG